MGFGRNEVMVFRINMKNNRYLFDLRFYQIALLSINVDSLVGNRSFRCPLHQI